MIRLIGTDFDGTVHQMKGRQRFAPELLEWLRSAQAAGLQWVVLSGRELNKEFARRLRRLNGDPLPDYIVTVEREIFARRDGWYHPNVEWNERCRVAHEQLFAREIEFVREMRRWLRRHTGARVYSNRWSPLNVRSRDLREADKVHRELLRRFQTVPGMTLARNTVFLRLTHGLLTKGNALAELALRLGIPRDEVFAAGDHYNDLSMLDGLHAGRVAAPANAIPEVKALVRKVGGYIASQECGLGTLEALRFYTKRSARAVFRGRAFRRSPSASLALESGQVPRIDLIPAKPENVGR